MNRPPAPRTATARVAPTTLVQTALLCAALTLAGCAPHPSTTAAPVRAADTPEMTIYRTVAESVYVRTTGRSVGIVSVPLDTACSAATCGPLARRWGLEPLWWAVGDSSSARAARADLLSRIARPMSLADVPDGQQMLQSIAPDSAAVVVAQPDTAHWTAFKEYHGGASGFLWFSPVGFDAQHRSAIVFVDWRCGPICGHTVAVSLKATGAGAWRIDDMLLLSSRQPGTTMGGR
ncbi:MAG TPA: hypothetical protein VIJ16_01020 [Gemmatimonadaceae bacterium]